MHLLCRLIQGVPICFILACAAPGAVRQVAAAAPADSQVELVESQPLETPLDSELRDAWQVWPEMFQRAQARIDLAEFYLSNEPGGRLEPCVVALLEALKRGVRVRVLADAGFARTYPETLARLSDAGAQVRKLDVKKLTGGVLHAKYFVIDGREGYLGSQNFDWRSLQHIEELGVRFRAPEPVRALQDVFDSDWSQAGGGPRTDGSSAYEFPQAVKDGSELTLSASPEELNPKGVPLDLPGLVQLIDSAKKSLRVQVLTYGGSEELSGALVRAAARGVQVQLLTSDWELRPRTLRVLRALDPRIGVRVIVIPPYSKGFIPFARVAHAKYCVADGARGWVGTSNWEPDYFEKSRNVGLFIDGGPLPAQLEAFFAHSWAYAKDFDRAADYAPPRISRAEKSGPSREGPGR